MGQQDSKPEIVALTPAKINNQTSPTKTNSSILNNRKSKIVQCQGLLKLQSIPFKNSIQIETQNEILFLQNVDITLKYLLEGRLNTNKLFTIEDIQRLIESVTFTLAYMQQNGIPYKDVHAENIFYDNGAFKLMPNELIAANSYQKLRENGDVYPSPQYIIALRCGEQDIVDDDIIQKSNIFMLGMILLEVATLLPGSDCYDAQNFDILDCVINQRVILVEQYYGEKIAKIIANMLDYDYTQRMNLKQLSIWVNRQLNLSKVLENSILQNHNHSTSIHGSKVQKQGQQKNQLNTSQKSLQKSKFKLMKNNSIYMDMKKQNEMAKQQKNKIYTKESQMREEISRTMYNDQHRFLPRNHQYQAQHTPNVKKQTYDRQSYTQMDNFKPSNGVNRAIKSNQVYQQKDNFTLNQERRTLYDKPTIDRQTATRRMVREQPFHNNQEQSLNIGYNHNSEPKNDNPMNDKTVLKQINMVGNQFYPKIDDLFKHKKYEKEDIKGGSNDNGSLNRIKQQILKSRKLIEQFKRSQGLKY